ncbi:hypothetical protein TrVE_jg3661 [Triparma verrucosa]|uniref:Cleft lip and palate associated transmembrane protein n=1 Tax=Triparma verrucosa TaxID=1606542 RepID=A0A9W7BW78_9STRA|nr:hypothetical protein TrVE_jg3661 [Triparma verrucosa]
MLPANPGSGEVGTLMLGNAAKFPLWVSRRGTHEVYMASNWSAEAASHLQKVLVSVLHTSPIVSPTMPSCSSLLIPLSTLLALFYLYTTITTFSHILYPLSSPLYADIVKTSKTRVHPWFTEGNIKYKLVLCDGSTRNSCISSATSTTLKEGQIRYDEETFDSEKIPITLTSQPETKAMSTQASLSQQIKDYGLLVGTYKYLTPSTTPSTIHTLDPFTLSTSSYLNLTLTFTNSNSQEYTITSTSPLLQTSQKTRFPLNQLLNPPNLTTTQYIPQHTFHLSLTSSVYPYELSGDLSVQRLSKSTFVSVPTLSKLPFTEFESNLNLGETVGVMVEVKKVGLERLRLYNHFGGALEAQKELGFEQKDIDDIRSMITDTSINYLILILIATVTHTVLEVASVKSSYVFWRDNESLEGLSLIYVLGDFFSQGVLLLFLINEDSSIFVTFPSFLSLLLAGWKSVKCLGFSISTSGLKFTRLDNKTASEAETINYDMIAIKTVLKYLSPVMVLYLVVAGFEEYKSIYDYVITNLSSIIYFIGFAILCPQLFINYRLKSVEALPWRALCYKFSSTFIDDIFAVVIRMPLSSRLACFRDDIVFFGLCYQRWIYKIDESRVAEGQDDIVQQKKKKKE